MSGPNAAVSLPPGDRDDAFPQQGGSLADQRVADVGREPQFDFGPEVGRAVERMRATLDDAQLALGELQLALKSNELARIRAAAWRLSETMMADPRAQSVQLRRAVMKPIGRPARAPAEA